MCVCVTGDVIEVKAPLGEALPFNVLKEHIEKHKPALVFLCQGESSTGTHQVSVIAATTVTQLLSQLQRHEARQANKHRQALALTAAHCMEQETRAQTY